MAEFKAGLICGRFQTFHNGHEKLINTALSLCDKVLVLIGSANVQGTKRNPFSINLRMAILKSVYRDEPRVIIDSIDDLSAEDNISDGWGKYLLDHASFILGSKPDLMVYGNDAIRQQWFSEDEVDTISELIVKRDEISASSLRRGMLADDYKYWSERVPKAVVPFYGLLREELMKVYDSQPNDYYLSEENCYRRLEDEYKKYGKLIFAVDFDDTIYDFHKKDRTYTQVIHLLHQWEDYSEVIMFTACGEEKYDFIKEYLAQNHIKYDGINTDSSVVCTGRKVYANVYLDDRGGLPVVYRNLSKLIDRIHKGEVKHE